MQDQIELFDNLNLLAGLRYDLINQEVQDVPAIFSPTGNDPSSTNDALIPRVGIVYQPLDNSFELDSYLLTNAAVFYQREHWRLGLNFNNLFDVNYFDSFGKFGVRNSVGSPGEPFTVLGSISIKL